MRQILFAFLATLTLALPACDSRPDTWTGWVYPDRQDLEVSEMLLGFDTFEQCQKAAIATLRSFPEPEAGDYECGHRCRWEPELGPNVCKETRK